MLKVRGGHVYAYRSIRRGGRVESMYLASGELAGLCQEQIAEGLQAREQARVEIRRRRAAEAEARQAGRRGLRDLRARLDRADAAVADWHRRTRRLADALLRAGGWHRHDRGNWRRRRMTTEIAAAAAPAPARPDRAELARIVAAGDVATLEQIVGLAHAELWRRAEAGTLNRGGVEEVLTRVLGTGMHRAEREALIAEAALLRLDLAPSEADPAIRLMADRASVAWLQVRLLEFESADLFDRIGNTIPLPGGGKPDEMVNHRKLAAIDRALSRASARLERSLIALARLRRLKLPPIVAMHVNVESARPQAERIIPCL